MSRRTRLPLLWGVIAMMLLPLSPYAAEAADVRVRQDALGVLLPPEALGVLPQASNPGARGSHVLRLQEALAALLLLPMEEVTGVYGQATTKAIQAFQGAAGIEETGRADETTLRAMFQKPSYLPGDTELPFWYAVGSRLIPWGAYFEVKDVRTGIVFTCYRMMGESHLDAEPATKEDTEKMFAAYAGVWSWSRRPILINHRGRIYAASMNGMPHGYHSNRDNGMPGHFCIHFAYARGDGSQRVDTDHLQATYEAFHTRWSDPATMPDGQ